MSQFSLKDYLDSCREKYSAFLTKKNFVQYQEFFGSSQGLYNFRNDILELEILNDRGIIEVSIAPKSSLARKINIDTILQLIELQDHERDALSEWELRKIVNKRFGLEKQADLFEENYFKVREMFLEENFPDTLEKIMKLEKIKGFPF